MAEQPNTRELITPGKHKVVVKSEITGRIKQAIQNAMAGGAKAEASTDDPKKANLSFDTAALVVMNNAALEQIVISVDGQTDDVLGKVLDLPVVDYDYVVAEVDKISQGLTDPKKN